MTPGFQTWYSGQTQDGKNWQVISFPSLEYIDRSGQRYRLAMNATTDGPTDVPDPFKYGPLWWCGAFHDGMYRDQVEVWDTDTAEWLAWHPTKDQADSLFDEAMESQGIGAIERKIIYEAVVIFGKKAFRDDRKNAVEHNPT